MTPADLLTAGADAAIAEMARYETYDTKCNGFVVDFRIDEGLFELCVFQSTEAECRHWIQKQGIRAALRCMSNGWNKDNDVSIGDAILRIMRVLEEAQDG